MDPRRYPSIAAAVTALIAQACGLVTSNHDTPADSSQLAGNATGASAGASSSAASGGSASGGNASAGNVTLSIGGTPVPSEPCAVTDLPFADQVVWQVAQQRVFYSWTTDEQVAELRGGTDLFSRSERAAQGRGLLFTELAAYGSSGAGAQATLADTLANDTFAKARFGWPNPWATLLGFPGESYGNQLLKIELVPEAWIASFDGTSLSVFDVDKTEVPIETALGTPQRIGAIFYRSRAEAGRRCGGTFSVSGVGFREFALGNIAMVARWSLATPEIGERLKSDVAELQAFEKQIDCLGETSRWSSDVTCAWVAGVAGGSALSYYDFALGLPSELYRPSAMNIEALIAALEASLPTGEPLVVTPGQ